MSKKLSIEEQIAIIGNVLFPEQKIKSVAGPYSYIATNREEEEDSK